MFDLKTILAMALLLGLGALRSVAADPTDTISNGKVVNSTYSFTDVGVSGPGDFNLDQTTIPNLNSLSPAVTLELVLTSVTYTEGSVTGNGSAPSILFNLDPTLGNINGNLTSIPVTLTAAPIANGVTESDVVFSLSSPLVFNLVDESNPGNTNEGTGFWQESLSNLEPTPDSITTENGSFSPNSVQNQDFSFNGSVEVFYATPEPSPWVLGLVASGLFAVLYRRTKLRS